MSVNFENGEKCDGSKVLASIRMMLELYLKTVGIHCKTLMLKNVPTPQESTNLFLHSDKKLQC